MPCRSPSICSETDIWADRSVESISKAACHMQAAFSLPVCQSGFRIALADGRTGTGFLSYRPAFSGYFPVAFVLKIKYICHKGGLRKRSIIAGYELGRRICFPQERALQMPSFRRFGVAPVSPHRTAQGEANACRNGCGRPDLERSGRVRNTEQRLFVCSGATGVSGI